MLKYIRHKSNVLIAVLVDIQLGCFSLAFEGLDLQLHYDFGHCEPHQPHKPILLLHTLIH